EKENNELIGKNNQLKSNQEKERIQFQESLEQINDAKNELKSTTLELEQELKDEKRVSQALFIQIDLLTENEKKMKARHQQDQHFKEETIKNLNSKINSLKGGNEALREKIKRERATHFQPSIEHTTDSLQSSDKVGGFDAFVQLEQQIHGMLKQSFEYEEKLDSRILIINELENKLQELTKEIDEIQSNLAVQETPSENPVKES
ncbi:hypothetical protein, partial [Bacillus sp. 220_BSPC]